jgi:hypothetical protein
MVVNTTTQRGTNKCKGIEKLPMWPVSVPVEQIASHACYNNSNRNEPEVNQKITSNTNTFPTNK